MNVAFIPVRGGSKSIPYKNIKIINGMPLVYWTLKSACECKYLEKVYVSTDDRQIKYEVEKIKKTELKQFSQKIEIIERSKESASDTATTEYAMLEFASKYTFANIVLIQATSPLLTSYDLDRGFEVFEQENVDSVISVVKQKRFNWSYSNNGFVYPINYDYNDRPRRQEFEGYFVENGAFYITGKYDLLKSKNRISGNIRELEMNDDSFFEIDEIGDWEIIEALMKKNGQINKIKIPKIKMFLTDCDGCLTDGGMYYTEKGDEVKKFNTRDGMGFALLKKKGIVTGIITSEKVQLNRRRSEKLKLDILEMGCENKVEAVIKYCEQYNISLENVCYIGDDLNDLEVIKIVGFGCAPGSAIEKVKHVSKYVAHTMGGQGVIREIADMILDD